VIYLYLFMKDKLKYPFTLLLLTKKIDYCCLESSCCCKKERTNSKLFIALLALAIGHIQCCNQFHIHECEFFIHVNKCAIIRHFIN